MTMTQALPPVNPQLLQLALDAKITEYTAVASSTLLVFDWAISLRKEVELVWDRPKSLVKWLYLWNRYFGIAITLCFIHQQVEGTGATIIIGTVDVILLIRIWILCSRSRRMMYVLVAMIIVEITAMLCITTMTVNSVTEYVHVGFITGCYGLGVPRYFSVYPVPSLIVSLSMFIITARNCYRRIIVSRPYNTQSIAVIFLRDGVLWFLVVALINPPQIGLWGWGRPTLIQVLMMPSFAAYSTVGARVLLNMMEIAAEGGADHAVAL
ncbi:hypothetical protein FB451DRAFT_734436 [Mycena latifolia]|nr:hypothetical protein FB451DRAFT_734436 [Mycena latifolia]